MEQIALFLIGVEQHNDPLQQEKLSRLIGAIADENQGAPAIVAVEYDKVIFEWIVNQRSIFRELLVQEWPDLAGDELDILERSLAFDGDAHLDIFPGTRTLWLDSGRPLPNHLDRDSPSYAHGRIDTYRYRLGNKSLHGNLKLLSNRLREVVDYCDVDLDTDWHARNKEFAQSLVEARATLSEGWILSINGAAHVKKDIPGSMAAILSDKGEKFEVRFLS